MRLQPDGEFATNITVASILPLASICSLSSRIFEWSGVSLVGILVASNTKAMQCISSRIDVSLLKPGERLVMRLPPVRLNLV